MIFNSYLKTIIFRNSTKNNYCIRRVSIITIFYKFYNGRILILNEIFTNRKNMPTCRTNLISAQISALYFGSNLQQFLFFSTQFFKALFNFSNVWLFLSFHYQTSSRAVAIFSAKRTGTALPICLNAVVREGRPDTDSK